MSSKDVFSKFRNGVEKQVRKGLNQVLESINDFESKGGVRGALDRSRVATERAAERLRKALESRGIHVDVSGRSEYDATLRRAYRLLDVEYGAELEVAKHAYRTKMKEHHPDRHSANPEAEKRATRIAQELSIAYDTIEAHFRGRR